LAQSLRGKIYLLLCRKVTFISLIKIYVAVVSFLDQINVLTLLAKFGKKLPIIVSERIDSCYHFINGIWSALQWLAYRCALAVIVLPQEAADWARRNLGCLAYSLPEGI
jgi:hypothetical protein